jgi:DNA-binding beta-propeller fold protein YncE
MQPDTPSLRTSRPALLCTVKGNQSITVIDEMTGAIIAAPVVGTPDAKPHEIILSADGRRAFVSLYGNAAYPDNVPANKIAVLDLASLTLDRVIDTDLYSGPHGLARDHLGRIWATSETTQCLFAIDPETCRIVRSIHCGARVHFLATDADRRVIYSSHKEVPFIGVHDVDQAKMVDRIPLEIGSQAICTAPDGARLYVADFCRPSFHVINTATREIERTVPLKGVPGWPYATPDGEQIVVSTFLAEIGRGYAEIFDARTFAPVATAEFSVEPFHILDGGDGRTILVVLADGRISRIDRLTGIAHGGDVALGARMPEQAVRVMLPKAGYPALPS